MCVPVCGRLTSSGVVPRCKVKTLSFIEPDGALSLRACAAPRGGAAGLGAARRPAGRSRRLPFNTAVNDAFARVVTAEPVGELARVIELPDGEVGALPGGERA